MSSSRSSSVLTRSSDTFPTPTALPKIQLRGNLRETNNISFVPRTMTVKTIGGVELASGGFDTFSTEYLFAFIAIGFLLFYDTPRSIAMAPFGRIVEC